MPFVLCASYELIYFVWQNELVSIIREQNSLIRESSHLIADTIVEISHLDAKNNHLTSNMARDALRFDQTVVDKDAIVALLTTTNATKTQEIETLTATLTSKDATIAQLQSVGVSGNVAVLQADLKRATNAANINADFAEREQRRADAAWLQLQSVQNPMAAGSTFNRILCVMNAAALATRSGPWNSSDCEGLVRTMVEGMVAVSAGAERTKTVNAMVVQVS